jgi:putative ABC transport system substrate-binding protein
MSARINRRELIALAGAAAWPVTARGQQRGLPVVGYLVAEGGRLAEPFRAGLAETGYVAGRNVLVEVREAGLHYDRLTSLATDLVNLGVAVIVAPGTTPVQLAAKAATTTIPIVFSTGSDPVKAGLVASLSRPGGNATGVTNLNAELGAKRLELLHEMVPAARTIAVLVNPMNPAAILRSNDLTAAARTLGIQVHVLHASAEAEFDAAFASLQKTEAGALLIVGDGLFVNRSKQLGEMTARYGVPTMFQTPEFTVAGGLMSYGTSNPEGMRMVGVYTGRILKGEKPADLPVQQATKVELMINVRTTKALGIALPLALRGRADELIE